MKRKDIWVLLGVGVLAAVLLILGQQAKPQPVKQAIPTLSVALGKFDVELQDADSYLRIKQGDEYYHLVPLNSEAEIVIKQDGNKENIIRIDKDSVVMHSANCPNQDCMRMGKLTLENREYRSFSRWITCLPHQLSLELLDHEEAMRLQSGGK
ncbi:MAG: hypothetical protein GX171_09340 [Clostridiales bacterium]|nr:hypothetical protein [Clostridiales bacterium]